MKKTLFILWQFVFSRYGLLASVGAFILVFFGFFKEAATKQGHWFVQTSAFALGVVLAIRLIFGRPISRSKFVNSLDRFEAGFLLLVCIYVLIQIVGGPHSWAQPVAYVAIACLVGFNERNVGLIFVVAALCLQASIHYAAGELPHDWKSAAVSAGFIVVFSFVNLVFMQVEVAKRRREHDQRLADEIQSMREEARDFRLISTALSSGDGQDRDQEESKLVRGAVEAIHQGMFFLLRMLKKALGLRTCVLLWLESSGRNLVIKEVVSDSNFVNELPIPAQAGALGGIVKNRLLLNLRSPRHVSRDIPYYTGPEKVGAFLGVPVLENGHLRGVLCADRIKDQVFSEAEEKLLVDATRQVLRSVQTEQVISAVERAKYEHERFYRASTMLNGALTLPQVYETAFSAARQIVEFDFAALTLYDRSKRKHTICRVFGEGQEIFEGKSFSDNAGLVAMVVKNKHFLPAGEVFRERDTVVFTKGLRTKNADSLVVLPLIVQDNAIGTFVVASNEKDRFPKRIREMLGVISNQVAVSIENAKMYKRMEEMATTDGLTGLPNHRTFQAQFSEMLNRAERHKKPVALIIADVDKFKGINDTHGHPTGDVVLRRLAQIFIEQARKVDLVARYGGEEFAMVLEETGLDGAKLFCERVRQEVVAQLMSSEKGSFRVSVSLGVATYPDDGTEKEVLTERADQALYRAKANGRNRTEVYREPKERKKKRTAYA
ncbi:MAG: sensor domain-containing diguanylate cyclase [Pseudomonadota bacterium]